MVALIDVQIVVTHVSAHASVSLLSNLQKLFVSSIWILFTFNLTGCLSRCDIISVLEFNIIFYYFLHFGEELLHKEFNGFL